MKEKDSILQYWSKRIDEFTLQYEKAKYNTSILHNEMNSAWQSLHDIQEQYRKYKEQADYEFEQAQYCWDNYDGAGAKEHSESGHMLNDEREKLRNPLDEAQSKYDPLKAQFDQAVTSQRSIKTKLDEAKKAHKARTEELKAQNIQEQMHWKEKRCKGCEAVIRYNDMWEHIPNYCKSCKEKFEYEQQQKKRNKREKLCKGCGKTIIYYIDWNNIPNYCKECRAKFEGEKKKQDEQGSHKYKLRFNMNTGKNDFFFGSDNPQPKDGHGHVVIGEDGQEHYVRDQYNPKNNTDRRDAVSYDDKYFFENKKP